MESLNIGLSAQFEIGSFSRSWDNRGYLGGPWIHPRFLFSKIFRGLLFGWTLWMYWLNLKSVAFPVREIIEGTRKHWGVTEYAHAPFSPKFSVGLCSDGPREYTAQFEIRSFSRSWDNRGYPKNWAVPGYANASFSPKFLMGFYSGGPSECTG